MTKLVNKPNTEVPRAAKAEIVRALYDAADKFFEDQNETGASPISASLVFDQLQKIIAQARELGGQEFGQSVEAALKIYTEEISAVRGDSGKNPKKLNSDDQ